MPESACLSLKSGSAEKNLFGRAWETMRAKHKKALMRSVHPHCGCGLFGPRMEDREGLLSERERMWADSGEDSLKMI